MCIRDRFGRWIVESEKDKSRHYNLDMPIGTWMVSMKVLNDDIWNNYVKRVKSKVLV